MTGPEMLPAIWRSTCDCCKAIEEKTYKARPAHWIDLHILRDAYDFQGNACADASVKLLLCTACADAVVKAVNRSFDEIREAARHALEGTTHD